MSQKVKITRARLHGSPVYLGDVTGPDGTVAPVWSADPARVVGWLCDGFRFRFNQRRSTRCRYLTCEDRDGQPVMVSDPADVPVLVPIGNTVTDITDAQARSRHSFLAAMPGYVLEATLKTEATDWFSAAKRRKTNVANGRKAGAMPGFRRKDSDRRFVCWFNGGRNAVFTKTGRRSGMVTISGANPKPHRAPGVGPDGKPHKPAWKVTLHVRLSQPIRDYTSVRVNWTRRELVLVNEPLPVTGKARTGEVIGIDRGVVHTAADDRGRFYDAPDTAALEKRRKFHQRRMAKSKQVAAVQGRRFWESKRYQAHKAAAAGLAAKQALVREEFAHQLSTGLVRGHDFIGIEKLSLDRMTRRGKGKGAAAKRGLNRVLARAALGRLAKCIEYKADLAGVAFVEVPPAYTSQRCHKCGHTARENRESQAVFSCKVCAWTGNADTNAAVNVREEALTRWAAERTEQLAGTSGFSPGGVAVSQAGSKSKTDPLTGPAPGPAASAMNRKPPNAA
ncbi:RNA-guided endonuclease InsQ/TnpB family protein [Candidatus Mycobacterium methanotrophicum]|uniref:Transposase n=1 Tax=Candidatus Mycobacterium methanotrophicum TaxID=2943498 RepID=A0ABY4QUG1_9MYCO|nr:RNA-guided endonuclease TnpB family protein [Candidatus Mycobacterium methanotrophicum]UQX13525.1 transposase [Candidatus Mycobacterium methanotrophicum]